MVFIITYVRNIVGLSVQPLPVEEVLCESAFVLVLGEIRRRFVDVNAETLTGAHRLYKVLTDELADVFGTLHTQRLLDN